MMAHAPAIDRTPNHSAPAHHRRSKTSIEAGLKGAATGVRVSLEKHAPFRVLESTARGFAKDRLTNAAAAMTYYGIFSLFPLLLLFMALAGLALQSNEQA